MDTHSKSLQSPSGMEELKQKIFEVLKTIYDPEIPVNIYEIGLIYEVKVDVDATTGEIEEANIELYEIGMEKE